MVEDKKLIRNQLSYDLDKSTVQASEYTALVTMKCFV